VEKFLLVLPLNPCSPLSHKYNVRFNGIRLPSVERVDFMVRLETDPIESGENCNFLSTRQDTAENTTPKRGRRMRVLEGSSGQHGRYV
jgi:hypothetical protein